jgi:hypothetical protein
MIGFIFKYQAIPAGNLMDDGCMPDPNFWLKKVKAIWSVCGPYRRQRLAHEGKGAVFFVPYSYARMKLGLPPVWTGVLVVDRIIPDHKTLSKSVELPRTYRSLYLKDLKQHLRTDTPRTKQIRGKNIVVGGSGSHWFGTRCVNLVPLLRQLKMKSVATEIEHNRVVRKLSDNETERLYKAVIRQWRRTKAIKTPPLRMLYSVSGR